MDHDALRAVDDEELNLGMSILLETVVWLESRGIRQWTADKLRQSYTESQTRQENFFFLRNGEIAAVLTLSRRIPGYWADETAGRDGTYLSRLAVPAHLRGENIGRLATEQAKIASRALGAPEIYLDCVHGNGFLPSFYRSLGFLEVKRKDVEFSSGIYDMVLMVCPLPPSA